MKTELTPDCQRCAALCCTMLAFDKGPKFAIDKPAGQPCPHLDQHACSIHPQLEKRGFAGCLQYDCLGAGQIVVQQIFGGASWRQYPELAGPMAQAFHLLRQVQEMRQQLITARTLCSAPEVLALCEALETRLTPDWSREALDQFDLAAAKSEHARLLALLHRHLSAASAETRQTGRADAG